MRLKKISVIILNVILISLWIGIQGGSLIFLLSSKRELSSAACKSIDNSFRDTFWRIESVNTLLRPYDFMNDFAYLSADEFSQLKYIDIVDAKLAVEKTNNIIGSPCECAIYFENSDYVLTAHGAEPLSKYIKRFAPIDGNKVDVAEKIKDLPDLGIVPSVQYVNLGSSFSSSTVFIRKNHYWSNVALVVVLSSEHFDKLQSGIFGGSDGTIGFEYGGDLFYGEGAGEQLHLDYFDVTVYADKAFDYTVFFSILVFSLLLFISIYVLFYKLVINNIYNINSRLLKLKNNVDDDSSYSVNDTDIKELKDIIYLINERENGALTTIISHRKKLVEICLKFLFSSSYNEEVVLLLKSNGFPMQMPRRIVVARDVKEDFGYCVDDHIFIVEGETYEKTGVVAGVSDLKYDLSYLKKSYEEAIFAYNFAVLYNQKDVEFSALPQFKELEEGFLRGVVADVKNCIKSDNRQGLETVIDEKIGLFLKDYYNPIDVVAVCDGVTGVFKEKLSQADQIIPDVKGSSILEFIKKMKELVRGYSTVESESHLSKINELKKYINENLTNPDLSLKYLADEFNYSQSYISKLFSENEENGYQKYVSIRRIELAKTLLSKNVTVAEIAKNCGFRQVKTFRSAFKEHTGMTPVEYREIHFSLGNFKDED